MSLKSDGEVRRRKYHGLITNESLREREKHDRSLWRTRNEDGIIDWWLCWMSKLYQSYIEDVPDISTSIEIQVACKEKKISNHLQISGLREVIEFFDNHIYNKSLPVKTCDILVKVKHSSQVCINSYPVSE